MSDSLGDETQQTERGIIRHAEVESDGGIPTLPSEEAFNPARLRFTTASGEQIDLEVVGKERIEKDAYINGRYGGRRQPLTLEGDYDGPHGEGWYVFHSTLTQEEGCDHVEVSLWRTDPFTDGIKEERISITDVEILE